VRKQTNKQTQTGTQTNIATKHNTQSRWAMGGAENQLSSFSIPLEVDNQASLATF
jgi:hypothetical protein